MRISEDAYDAFTAFAVRHGVTLTALVEAMGERLANPDAPLTDLGKLMVSRALEIDQRHRSRRTGG